MLIAGFKRNCFSVDLCLARIQLIKIHSSDRTHQARGGRGDSFPMLLSCKNSDGGILCSQINGQLCTTAGQRLVSVRLCMCVVRWDYSMWCSSPDLGGAFTPSVIKPTGPPSRHYPHTISLMYTI